MRLAVLMLFVVGLLTCNHPTQPSQPSPLPPSSPPPSVDMLVIMPAITGLRIGDTQALGAVLMPGSRPVTAAWSSDAADVVTVQPDGRATGVRVGSAMIHAVYQTFSATLPLHVVASDYSGNWSGQYHVIGCFRTAGNGSDICKEELAAGGSHWPFAFSLSQSGTSVTGTLQFMDNTGKQVVETGPVSGIIDASSALTLTGTTTTTDPSEPAQTTLAGWSTSLASDGLTMTGRFTQNRDFQNIFGRQQVRLDCELVNVRR